MASRTQRKLTDIAARSSKLKAGRHSDGGGLYLNVTPSGSRSWLFMWVRDGRRREMGLGSYPTVTLASARAKADQCRLAIEEGRDPIVERNKEAEPTFGECADQLIASMEKSWRNAKHKYQWEMTLGGYCSTIRAKRVSSITTEDVLSVLSPIWSTKSETASRLRGRIERVLEYAKVKGWREGENPALWRGHLRNVLPPRQKLTRGHLKALPYGDLPDFLVRVRAAEAMAARALEFVILTAARSGEAIGATWTEIDLDKAIWTVPGNRMKMGKEHVVPLSDPAIALLRKLFEARTSSIVFSNQEGDRQLSNMAMTMFMRRLKVDVTVHGFRSAFRDWCGEETNFPREVAEQALAHQIGDSVERAYRRGNALAKRRQLMQAWADFCDSKPDNKVVVLRA